MMTENLSEWKVLIVEDDSDNMELFVSLLEYYDMTIYPATSAEGALKLLDNINPTLALLDLALPEMDGWGLLNVLRQHPNTMKIPMIAVTAFHSAHVAQQAMKMGFNGYFSKPIDSVTFIHEIKQIIVNYHLGISQSSNGL